MVRAWVFNDNDTSDQRSLHQHYPNQPIDLDYLSRLGIHYWHINDISHATSSPDSGLLGDIRKQRGYKNYDIVDISPTKLPNYEEKIKIFFNEHLHEDEEIRLILDGSGYFDIRDEYDVNNNNNNNRWLRIHCFTGDMIVLPAGSYHRFTMDNNNYTKAMRLFKDAPKWEALNRSVAQTDQTNARQEYVAYIKSQHDKLSTNEQKEGETSNKNKTHTSIVNTEHNGTSYTLSHAAGALANYPHMRAFNGLLYVSGLSSRKLDGTHRGVQYNADGSVKSLDIKEQTAAVLENIENILRTAGADLTDVVDTTCFLTDMSNYKEFNNVYNQYFPVSVNAPTRTTIAVKQLPHPNLLIEIKSVAVDPKYRK